METGQSPEAVARLDGLVRLSVRMLSLSVVAGLVVTAIHFLPSGRKSLAPAPVAAISKEENGSVAAQGNSAQTHASGARVVYAGPSVASGSVPKPEVRGPEAAP